MMRREGYEIGRKLVVKLMQEMGLYTIYPKANLSKRNFKPIILESDIEDGCTETFPFELIKELRSDYDLRDEEEEESR